MAILLLLALPGAFAQTAEEIRRNPDYLWGTGSAETLKQADNDALAALVSQISTRVSSHFETLLEERKDKGEISVVEKVNSIIRTYSQATLNNTRRIVLQNEPKAAVMRYIRKSDVQRIFEGRKSKLLDFAREAQRMEKRAQVADALRYYYWAYVLLQSYPDGNFLTMEDDAGNVQLLITWIPKQMDDIFSHIRVRATTVRMEDQLKVVTLNVMYKDLPARNYDYSYFDGRDWSNLYSVKDGTGIIELPVLAGTRNIRLKTEYMFEGEANIDSELAEVMKSIPPIAMRNSYLTLNAEAVSPVSADTVVWQAPAEGQPPFLLQAADRYEATMHQVLAAIESRDEAALAGVATDEGREMFRKLIGYGNGKIVKQPAWQFLDCGDEIVCRSLSMSFSFKGNRRTFVEDVVFRMDREARITGLAFGLDKPAVDDIMGQTSWGDTARLVLVNFLEDYKTAYALKRLSYIQDVFSDEALIITGRVLNSAGYGEKQPLKGVSVKYTRQRKEEYLKKLAHVFRSNEYVNLRFADNRVRKSGLGEVYGIQIKQDYFSSSYGDTGYLFLMVDLNDPRKPIIHVRTWQPQKDPYFGLIDISYF